MQGRRAAYSSSIEVVVTQKLGARIKSSAKPTTERPGGLLSSRSKPEGHLGEFKKTRTTATTTTTIKAVSPGFAEREFQSRNSMTWLAFHSEEQNRHKDEQSNKH